MALRRTAINLDQFIVRPLAGNIIGPQCATCNRVVDYEALVEGDPGIENDAGQVTKMAGGETCRVLVRHHGAEEIRTIDFGSREWGPKELARWMTRILWFDPREVIDAGRLQR